MLKQTKGTSQNLEWSPEDLRATSARVLRRRAKPAPKWRNEVLPVVFGRRLSSHVFVRLMWVGLSVVFVVGVFIPLVAPLWLLPYVNPERSKYVQRQDIISHRGRILDRNSGVLSESIAVPSIWANPKEVIATAEQRVALAKIFGLTGAELESKLRPELRFAWLRRLADDEIAAQVKARSEEHTSELQSP